MLSDAKHALRALRATPIVTAVAVLSLALGIGANTAIFSILNTLLLRSLPVKDPQQLALVGTNQSPDSWTNPIWEQIRDRPALFAGSAAWAGGRFNTVRTGQAEFVDGLYVSGRFFDVLGVPAILGRTLTAADDARFSAATAAPVAVISYDYWQQRFGGAADAIGKPVLADGVTFTVVGVTPPGFFGPEVGSRFQIAMPLASEALVRGRDSMLDERSAWWLTLIVRRRADQSLEAATAALRGVQPQIRLATISPRMRAVDLDSYLKDAFTLLPAARGASYLRDRYQRPLTTIMVVVGLVLLIASANIANLQLARANARRHELSVRRALGASRVRIARLLLSESLLLSAGGALLGLLFAQWGSRLLVRLLSTSTDAIFLDLSIDWRILGFTAAVTIVTAILFGSAPSLRATSVEPNEALKEHARGIAGDARFGLGSALVVVQVALSVVLVAAAGLFVRTFFTLTHQPLGFDQDRVLVADVNAGARVEKADRAMLFQRLRDATISVPGVSVAAASVVTPVSGRSWGFLLDLPDGPALSERERVAHVNVVTVGFFDTYGTRMIAGRDFTKADGAAGPPVVIVNEAFVRKFMGGRNPIGRTVRQAGFPGSPAVTREVVGFVQDAIYRNLRQAVPPTMYIPIGQQPELWAQISVSVRAAAGNPALLTRGVADALSRVSPDVSITFQPLAQQVSNSLTQERLVATLSGFFGGLALLLASIGLYGVTSYAVSRRRTEIGVRMALGAEPGGVVRMVLRRVVWLVGLGIATGALVTVWAAQFVASLLYGLTPRDPITLSGAALALALIGAAAGWVPAWRASRIDPARVLREG